MSKDDLETQCMNELFDSGEDDVGYYNHWRPVAYCDWEGNKIRNLTKEEQLKWIKQQKEREK
jgi:hypothetical protein